MNLEELRKIIEQRLCQLGNADNPDRAEFAIKGLIASRGILSPAPEYMVLGQVRAMSDILKMIPRPIEDHQKKIITELESLLKKCDRHPDKTLPCIENGCEDTGKNWDYNLARNRGIKLAIEYVRDETNYKENVKKMFD